MLPVMACHRAVGGFGLDGAPVGGQQDGCHQSK